MRARRRARRAWRPRPKARQARPGAHPRGSRSACNCPGICVATSSAGNVAPATRRFADALSL